VAQALWNIQYYALVEEIRGENGLNIRGPQRGIKYLCGRRFVPCGEGPFCGDAAAR